MAQRRTKRDRDKRDLVEDDRDTHKAEEERIPLHEQRDIMSAPDKDGFVRRWVNEKDRYGSRIERFVRAGWRPVTDNLPIGAEAVVEHNDSLGDIIRKNVGGEQHAILMEIPQEYYDADQAHKAEKDDAKEQAIKRTIKGGDAQTTYYKDLSETPLGVSDAIKKQKGHNVA